MRKVRNILIFFKILLSDLFARNNGFLTHSLIASFVEKFKIENKMEAQLILNQGMTFLIFYDKLF